MYKGLSAPFIHRPIATTLIMVAVFLVGLVAFPSLPVAPLREVAFPTITVSASLPGRSPRRWRPRSRSRLERQIAQIPGVSTNDVDEFARRNGDHRSDSISTVTSTPPPTTSRLRLTPPPANCRRISPRSADLSQGQSVRHPHPHPVRSVGRRASYRRRRRRRKHPRPAPPVRSPGVSLVRVGGQQDAGHTHPGRSGETGEKGLQLEDVRVGADRHRHRRQPQGRAPGTPATFTIQDNDQLTDRQALERRQSSPTATATPVRVRDVGQAVAGPTGLDPGRPGANGKPQRLSRRVQDSPASNVISTVDAIKKLRWPTLQASISADHTRPAFLSIRTTTIRASGVPRRWFTLMLTIALVVMVIFVFLRNLWATIIPSITVPLALLGACALMWIAGYSLDNLSLMAFTISVGFVVDDAIVMLENITRHIEEGEKPFQAALKGSAEIGFTIISISVSLVAVLIPLLMMSGIIGRLFREFSITIAMTIFVSAFVSLTLTPMMASRFLKSHDEERHGRLYNLSEKGFVALANGYERGVDFVLRHRFATLLTFIGTVIATGYLFVVIPKGFFPQQDTGILFGTTEAGQDVSFHDMYRLQQEVGRIVMADPAVDTMAMGLGSGVGNAAQNNGRMFITLKLRDERDVDAFQVIARLRPKLAQVPGMRVYLQAAQDVTVGARFAKTQFQYTLQDANFEELSAWANKILEKLQSLPQLRDVATDQQNSGATLTLKIDRDMASRYGIQPQLIDDTLYDAFGQRQVTQYFTQVNTYYVIEEVLPNLLGDPATLDKIYVRSPTSNQMVPVSAFAKWTTAPVAPLSISHQGQFPAITISFNLAQGVALGTATEAIQRAMQELQLPPGLTTTFQGNAQAFQDSLTSVPLLILAALVCVYLILGVLYESFIHPLTILSTLPSAGFGALAMLMLFGYEFSLIALIGTILLIGIVKKNGIMMVDFAISAEREEGLSTVEAIRKAALMRFRPIMMTTMAALLGGVPLMLSHGTGSELRQPLGYTMVGGLIVSQALTLFTTPVIYIYLDQVSKWLSGSKRAKATARTPTLETESQTAHDERSWKPAQAAE